MTKTFKYIFAGTALAFLGVVFFNTTATSMLFQEPQLQDPQVQDSIATDDTTIPRAEGPQFKLQDDPAYPNGDLKPANGIQLQQPSNLKSNVEYDPNTGQYIFTNKIGNVNYRRPSSMSIKEFQDYETKRTIRDYWETQANGGKSKSQRGFKPSFNLGSEAMDRIFGSSTINIVPQGQAELIFGVDINTTENPIISENLRTTTSFNFEEKIQMNVTGTIGERLKLGINYNTEATFEFENKTKLDYSGDEDDIIKKVEAGDVTLPLPGTLITGSQSLFGIKTEMQFGKLNVTTVLSQQKGQTQEVKVQGGAQVSEFEIPIDEYEANKHFFLAHYFKDEFDNAHKYLPRLSTGVTITKMEVWVTNRKGDMKDARSVVAFVDLGETKRANLADNNLVLYPAYQYADNKANELYNSVKDIVHDGKTVTIPDNQFQSLQSARPLAENEYSYDKFLGYISLNSALNADEILAVAYEYQINGRTYKVGELSSDDQSKRPLVVKLLKGVNLSPRLTTWDLMMKNIYSLGAYELSNTDFYLDILYRDDANGADVNYIPVGTMVNDPLIHVFKFDNVNSQQQEFPDGVFDFLDGVTIDKRMGRIIFPMREPFGDYLGKYLIKKGIADTAKYGYYELYDSTQTKARLVTEKNKFKLKGTYKSSSSSEIYLNAMNVPQGSVKVSSGGMPLVENQDYVVDYTLGTVKIINSAVMSSGQPVKVSLENNSAFNMQTKTLVGSHFDYKISDDFNIGATIMHLNERPLTTKVNIGDEPISNTIWGLNTTYRTNSQFLTSLVDKLPLLQTKETSNITLMGEFAQLIPGSSSAIGKNGVAYIDDFEGSETSLDIKSLPGWTLASAPTGRFPEARLQDSLAYGFNRAKLAWYIIDPLFHRDNSSLTPAEVKKHPEWRKKHNAREVLEGEIFPNRYKSTSEPTYLQVLNLSFYPQLRGPYNYDVTNIDYNGNLTNPQARWGGIMKQIYTSDFEASNIEYIEFWMMDPFLDDSIKNNGGDLYFNLGDISEDILKDGRMAFEQGLPGPGDLTDYYTTSWGRVSSKMPLDRAFVNGTGVRTMQDVGFDGLNDADEQTYFKRIINRLNNLRDANAISQEAYDNFFKDPSSDDFRYFKDESFDKTESDIVARYIDYNGNEANSPEGGALRTNYTTPDMEDINSDNTLNDKEAFFEYHVSLRPEDFVKGQNYIVDKVVPPKIKGNDVAPVWYQFKIPISEYSGKVGDIEDLKSIRFIRMYMNGFSAPVTVRFATLDFVRSEWRKYQGSLTQGSEGLSEQPRESGFEIQSKNIEENNDYVLPPGIDRTVDPTQTQYRALNEQSMVLKVDDLSEGDSKAAFKNVSLDMRQYKRLKMFTHCENVDNLPLKDGDVTVFIRIGSDNKNNYYEYEIPMMVSPFSKDKKPEIIWPEGNMFDIELDKFQRLKQARNDASVSFLNVYQELDGKNKLSICGNPTLSAIKCIMIGVRNPGSRNNAYTNDAMPKSAEIWINELRLTDFSDQGGWAANARAQFKLADFGNFRVSGSTMQPGFGSIEKKVNDREKVETNQYDLSTDLELGKFFPEKAQVKIPFYASYSQIQIKPQYNPLDPDVPLQAALDNAKNDPKRLKQLEDEAIDLTIRRSFSFTNVKVNKSSRVPKPYDPANFSVGFGYYDQKSHNYAIEKNNLFHHEGNFNYVFNNRPNNITPLQKVSFLNAKPLRIIKDINFNYSPTSIGFRTNLARDLRISKRRNLIKNNNTPILETMEHDFNWYRIYDVKYDLSRAIKIDFTAKNNSKIDEWYNNLALRDQDNETQKMYGYGNMWTNIKRGGRTVSYNQQLNVTYNVPINKLPLLDWVTANARYGANFEWQYQPGIKTDTRGTVSLGNNISNARTLQLNGNFSLSTIYNKVGYLRDLQGGGGQQRGRGAQAQKQQKEMKTVRFEKTFSTLTAGVPRSISHKLGSEDVTIKVTNDKGKEVKGNMEVNSANRLTFTPDSNATNVNVVIEGKVEAGANPLLIITRTTVKLLTGVKSINVSYSQTEGTALNGYLPKTAVMGSQYYKGASPLAPGYEFLLGSQNNTIIRRMNRYGWLANDTLLSGGIIQTNSQTLNIRVNYEPFRGLRIDLTGMRSFSRNKNSNYVFTDRTDTLYLNRYSSPVKTGNFSMSVMAFSSIEKLDEANRFRSAVFKDFKANRTIIRDKLIGIQSRSLRYNQDVIANGNQEGFSENSQQTLVPTFLATYAGYDINKVTLDLFPDFTYIRPNWRVSYDGLSEIPIIEEYFQSVTLNHAYTATYSIGSYMSNSQYKEDADGFSFVRSEASNYFVPEFDVSSVSISEQFSPYFGIDMTWKNNLTTRFEYKKNRMVSLGLTNYSLNDAQGKEYVFGVGYRFPDMPLNMIIPSGNIPNIKSDLDLRADFSIRDDITVLRMLDTDNEEVNEGNRNVKLSLSADYSLSDRLSVRLFFDRLLTDPRTSKSFKTINTKFGFSIRFTLAQ